MMAKQLLINIDDIMSRTSLSGNIDSDKLVPHIENAQIVQLLPVIGDGIYNKLLELVESNDISLPANQAYKTLWIEYITPTLVFYTMELFLPFHMYSISNAGINIHDGDNLQPAPKEDVDFLVQKYRNLADAYATNMDNYLCKHSSSFPEKTQNELEYPMGASYRTGVYLGM